MVRGRFVMLRNFKSREVIKNSLNELNLIRVVRLTTGLGNHYKTIKGPVQQRCIDWLCVYAFVQVTHCMKLK
jgi:hypothetical protein